MVSKFIFCFFFLILNIPSKVFQVNQVHISSYVRTCMASLLSNLLLNNSSRSAFLRWVANAVRIIEIHTPALPPIGFISEIVL